MGVKLWETKVGLCEGMVNISSWSTPMPAAEPVPVRESAVKMISRCVQNTQIEVDVKARILWINTSGLNAVLAFILCTLVDSFSIN